MSENLIDCDWAWQKYDINLYKVGVKEKELLGKNLKGGDEMGWGGWSLQFHFYKCSLWPRTHDTIC